jgi:hypothetical protein
MLNFELNENKRKVDGVDEEMVDASGRKWTRMKRFWIEE